MGTRMGWGERPELAEPVTFTPLDRPSLRPVHPKRSQTSSCTLSAGSRPSHGAMTMKRKNQRTIGKEITLEGVGIHSGVSAKLTFRPAAPGSGLRFRRVDLDGFPEVPADVDHVVDTHLGTSLGAGEARVMTVEHVLASVAGAGLDNVVMDVSGPEPPIRDGSFRDYLAALAS